MRFGIIVLKIVLSTLFLAGSYGEADAEERFALVLGNSKYENATPLRNPENDVEVVSYALKQSNFRVTKIANVGIDETKSAIKGFIDSVSQANNPVLFFYFAGHAVEIDGLNYLLPIDVSGSEDTIKEESLSLNFLMEQFDTVQSKFQLFILDSCRDNPFEANTRSLTNGLGETPQKLGKVIAYSTAPGKVASDGDTGTSPYSSALAESIMIPGLKVEDVFKRVRTIVKERTGGKQETWENSAIYGDFQFTEGTAKATDTAEIQLFEFASLADSQEAYQKYLNSFPNGVFASLAERKIEFMNKDFSFRKKSDIFKVVEYYNDYNSPCNSGKFNGVDPSFISDVSNNEIILLNIEFYYTDINCKYTSYIESTEEEFTAVIANEGKYFHGLDWEEYSKNSTILNNYFPNAKNIRFMYNSRVNNSGFSITLDRPVEGAVKYINVNDCEGLCFSINALVKFIDESQEEDRSYRFEVVSAADLGLTWKYQNTLQSFNDRGNGEDASRLEDQADQIDSTADTSGFRVAKDLSGWNVVAIVSDGNTLINCRAFKSVGKDTQAFFRKHENGNLTYGFFNPKFKFENDMRVSDLAQIDRTFQQVVDGYAYSENEIAFNLGSSPEIAEQLKSGTAIAIGKSQMKLTGSREVIDYLETCWTAFKR